MPVKWKRKAAEEKAPKKPEPKPKKKLKEVAPPPPPAEPSTALAAPSQAPQAPQAAPEAQGSTVTARLSKSLSLDLLSRRKVDVEKERKKLNVLPTYACSQCMIGPECPEFKEGYVCAFEDAFNAFPVRDVDSVTALMREIVDTNKKRLFFALVNERLVSGGEASPVVTRLSEVVMGQAKDLVQLQQDADRVSVEIEASGGGETTEKKKVGILTMLFGGGGTASALEEHKPEVLDVSASTTEEEYPAAYVGREQDPRDQHQDADEVLANMTEVI